jgi:hypothetical protein
VALLSDDQAERLRGLISTRTWGDAGRWIAALLDDRRDRVALALRTSRLIELALRDLGRGERDRDLERILTAAKKSADAPWVNQLPCEECGAPAIRVGTDGARHGLVVMHPDGRRCAIRSKT